MLKTALSLAEKYDVEIWEVLSANIEFLFADSGFVFNTFLYTLKMCRNAIVTTSWSRFELVEFGYDRDHPNEFLELPKNCLSWFAVRKSFRLF